jgi:hypothetical protein
MPVVLVILVIPFHGDKTKSKALTQAVNGVKATYPVVIWPVGLQPR